MWNVSPMQLARLGQRKGTDYIHYCFCKPTPSTHLLAHPHSTVQEEKPEVAVEPFRLKVMLAWSGAQRGFPVGTSDARCCVSEKEVFPVDAAPITVELMFPFFELSWNKIWTIALNYGLFIGILVTGVMRGKSTVRYGARSTGLCQEELEDDQALGGLGWTWRTERPFFFTEHPKVLNLPSPPLN